MRRSFAQSFVAAFSLLAIVAPARADEGCALFNPTLVDRMREMSTDRPADGINPFVGVSFRW